MDKWLMINKDGKITDAPITFCYFCDFKKNIEEHHIIRKKDGGTDEDDNKISLCIHCHKKLHRKFERWMLRYISQEKIYFMDLRNEHGIIKTKMPNLRQYLYNKKEYPKKSLKIAISLGKIKTKEGGYK